MYGRVAAIQGSGSSSFIANKKMGLALFIFIPTVALLMLRPKPFNEATAAALGAAIMLLVGVVSPLQTWELLQANANILFFFLGLMIISVVADQAGFFEWCALKSIKMANGKGPVLLSIVFGLGALLTAFFSNDATALILTPIVFALVTRLKLNPLPYVFACAFIANTASMLLPVSNPVNLLAVGRFDLTLGEYLKFLFLPSVLVIALNMGLFALIFRKDISTFSPDNPPESVKIDRYFLSVSAGLGLIAVGYVLVSLYGLPLAYPAVGGAVFLLACGFGFRRLQFRRLTSGISWYIFLFIFALALLVKGLENAGVTQAIAHGLASLASQGPLQALFTATVGTAVGSNLINNWSMMMVSVSSLSDLAANSSDFDRVLVYGSIMGADLGPNLTILGSLSSMLWLVLLRQRGLNIHPLQYMKLGLIVTPPLLIVGVLSLYACSKL
jgi:arsenical pump membrane protein